MRHFPLLIGIAMVGCAPAGTSTPEMPSTCHDGRRDGDETGVDCGGSKCPPCGDTMLACQSDVDCPGNDCFDGSCVPPEACSDGRRDFDETGVDCGGHCGICPFCRDGMKDGTESDVDCGGDCPACGSGLACNRNLDCLSGSCVSNLCVGPAQCADGVRDGGETDIDCGGPCQPCRSGMGCVSVADCGGVLPCFEGTCAYPSCSDGLLDGEESDIDCGGTCPPCAVSQKCHYDSDCAGSVCMAGVCVVPVCKDGKLDGNESDIDCGGICSACAEGLRCFQNSDCVSQDCKEGLCFDPTVPRWGAPITQKVPPPPVSGGTLLVRVDGITAFAADPDRDAVFVVDLKKGALVATVALLAGDEPGRLVEDGAGRVHVVLRGGGALIDLDAKTFQVIARRAVCPAPRGIAYQAAGDLLHVACAGGELVSLPAAGGGAVRTLHLDRDLRDVVVDGRALYLSRFRSSELLILDEQGAIVSRSKPTGFQDGQVRHGSDFEPTMAWRALALPKGGVAMVHQRALSEDVPAMAGGYAEVAQDQCGGSIVHAAVSTFRQGIPTSGPSAITDAVLPVDLAISPSGAEFVVVAAGNSHNAAFAQVFAGLLDGVGGCLPASGEVNHTAFVQPTGQATAVAFGGDGALVVQTREPATLQILTGKGMTIALSQISREDTGHSIFHSNSGGFIACASCHGEGGDDGHVWQFAQVGSRRTQSLRGGVLAVAPFHWDGALKDLPTLVDAVFVTRMAGPKLSADQMTALSFWVNTIPALPQSPPADPASVTRGAKLFADPNSAGCATCHAGDRLTSKAIVNVGTGRPFKVASLSGVAWRAPFLHDGCAPTLLDRFSPCGGGDLHGVTSKLSQADLLDLVAYLETL